MSLADPGEREWLALEDVRLRSDRRFVMTALALHLIPTVWFYRTDVELAATDAAHFGQRLAVRTLLVVTCIIGLATLRRIRSRETYRDIVLILSLALAAGTLALNALRPAGGSPPLRVPLYVMAILYFGIPNTFWRQVVPPLLLAGGLVVLRLAYLTGSAQGDPGGDILVLGVLAAVGMLAVRRRVALEADEARAVAELQTLRGIIPICAHCKKVRTDAGTWLPVETYVRARSAAEFSHGICPSCESAHYAGVK